MSARPRVSMLTADELGHLLGLDREQVVTLLERRGIAPVREGTFLLYSCAQLQDRLTASKVDRLQRAAAAKGLALREPEGTVYGHPQLGPHWHPTLNGDLRPWRVGHCSTTQAWWSCPAGPDHVWKRRIDKSLEHGRFVGCPFCMGRRASVTNSLETQRPESARLWHPTKNGNLTPADVLAKASKLYWWRCSAGPDHEWRGRIPTGNPPCPFCDKRQMSVTNTLATVAPALAAQWHPTKNGSLTPHDVRANSMLAVWWKCPNGPDHEWRNSIARRMAGRGCQFCAPTARLVSEGINLAKTHPELANEWDWERNGDLTPSTVLAGSAVVIWWKCAAGHRWAAKPNARTAGQGGAFRGCPYCSGHKASTGNCLADAFPEVATQWHPTKNGQLSSSDVLPGSRKRVWWRCERSHEWRVAVNIRALRGSSCPYCVGHRVAPEDSLGARHPELAAQWHPTKNGEVTPWDVGARSGRKVWWRCVLGHEWQAIVGYRLRRKDPLLCPRCAREVAVRQLPMRG